MNDPHVERLHYRIRHDQTVRYDKAPPLVCEMPLFTARIEGDRAVLEMKGHFASEEEAKSAAAPFLQAWEVWAGLERDLGEFGFTYVSCDVVDRRPPPGNGAVVAAGTVHVEGFPPSIRVDQGSYPEAPDHFAVSPAVRDMYNVYSRWRQGKDRLGTIGNLVYTRVIEESRGQQTAAAKRLGIDRDVLKTLSDLCATRGGPSDARKAKGLARDFTREERRWLEEAVKVVIRRAGEVAADPARNRPVITMRDLPDL